MTAFTWPVDRTCFGPLPPIGNDPDNPSPEYSAALAARNSAEDTAVFVLWALSARQFGGEPIRLRPCPPRGFPADWYLSGSWWPYGFDWSPWQPIGCGCSGICGLSGATRLHLPGPVYPPTDESNIVVKIDGEVLDPADWVLEGDVLYRRNGVAWPSQNLALPLGEPGTWSVDYQRGQVVPAGVDALTGVLAKEMLIACGPDKARCRIPRTVVSTTTRGVTHSFDPSRMLKAGKTGLEEVDLWLAAVNPNALMCAPEVL